MNLIKPNLGMNYQILANICFFWSVLHQRYPLTLLLVIMKFLESQKIFVHLTYTFILVEVTFPYILILKVPKFERFLSMVFSL